MLFVTLNILSAKSPYPIEDFIAQSRPALFLDYWSGSSDNLTTVFYIQVGYDELKFEKNGTRFEADYFAEILIYNETGELVGSDNLTDRFSIDPSEYFDTRSQYRLIKIPLNLNRGEYRVLAKISDRQSGRTIITERNIEIENGGNELICASDILLAARLGKDSKSQVNVFPAAAYGKDQEELHCYFEIYSSDDMAKPAAYSVFFQSPEGLEHNLKSGNLNIISGRNPVSCILNTSNLPEGTYQIGYRLECGNGSAALEKTKTFYVYRAESGFEQYSKNETIELLSPILPKEDLVYLKEAKKAERENYLNRIWESLAIMTGFSPLYVRSEYFRRYKYARENFGNRAGEDQFLNDQGQVFLLYGEPENIGRKFDPIKKMNLEVWDYPDLPLQIVFQETPFGDFELVSNTTLASWLKY